MGKKMREASVTDNELIAVLEAVAETLNIDHMTVIKRQWRGYGEQENPNHSSERLLLKWIPTGY